MMRHSVDSAHNGAEPNWAADHQRPASGDAGATTALSTLSIFAANGHARELRAGTGVNDTKPILDQARPKTPRVSVVIPTLNEAKNLPHVFAKLPSDIYEIVLVDGNSTDDTVEGGGSADITRLRRMGNAFLSGLVNLLYRTSYSDLCYGYNAFWASCLPVISVDCDGFEVETLINIRVAKAGLVVTEVPSFELDRIHGESNLRTFRDGFRVLKTIVGELRREPIGASAVSATAG